jgi:hypothetical protein
MKSVIRGEDELEDELRVDSREFRVTVQNLKR